MRLSELNRRSGVSNASIKYYLREGLLPPGRTVAANQAEYDERHLHRLRLIRALIGVRGLSVSAVKRVLDIMSACEVDHDGQLAFVFGILPVPSTGMTEEADDQADTTAANALLEEMGWQVTEDNPARRVIGQSLHTLRSVGLDCDWKSLVPYARLAEQTATLDLDRLQVSMDPKERAERAVLLTFLLEPTLLALRRLAQESESTARYESQ